ncbi:NAD-dependent succinate-semialdehyde dehydrogenase [uncultured Jannaschia sp.]|uniref:NAD-dependent succinate-semialdehyde dehydrogenase n=1 Tax=uncultured Jannaschia sp. TaxID=293347 RepID=UPI00261B712A|nr:NAD-dependent succinate-semialdehyde dehydrogenase [uncultured Jannaschia sp.]
MHDYPTTRLLIDGEWRTGADGDALPVLNPATEDEIGRVACATLADLDDALDATVRGFEIWSATSPFNRSGLMHRASALLRERTEVIAALMTAEQGKPLAQARIELHSAADTIDWFAEEARRTYGMVVPARVPGVTQMTLKQPVGPVAAFTPWNFPVMQIARKMSAALAAGCSMIVKAPEETPASPAAFIRCFEDAGLPAGVLGLVYGDPAEISSYLIPHPAIAKISFTGSTAIGKQLAGLAGQHMKRATMELGGHAPVIVAEDADIDAAVAALVPAKYRNAGQVCISPTRFLVQKRVADRFVEAFVNGSRAIRTGPGDADGTDMGPLANSRRPSAIEEMIADATEHGGKIALGGRRLGNKGWFFEPTVLTDVPDTARIMTDEPFGPVAVINRFDRIDDALAEANRLPIGLASYAFTTSGRTQQILRDRMRAGMLSINHIGLGLPELPFGGIRDSGYGTEGGPEAIDAYLDHRLVTQLH